MKILLTTLLMVVMPLVTWAHEGHGVFHDTGFHYLLSFWHIIPVALIAMGIWLITSQYAKNHKKPLKK